MPVAKGTTCKFCDKVYIIPCHGKRYDCGNAVFIRSKGKVDIAQLPYSEVKKLAKTGNIPDPSKMRQNGGRISTVEAKPEKPKKRKKRRVRL